jgi:uncharacterized membrane protein YeaQ/YmgE (transglycosylase-associated protein family)
MWDIILWFVIGGAIGYLAQRYVLLGRPGMVADIVAGALAALIVNVILSLLIPGYFSLTMMNVVSLGVALVAAIFVTMIVHATTAIVQGAKA